MRRWLLAPTLLILLAAVACGDDGEADEPEPAVSAAETVPTPVPPAPPSPAAPALPPATPAAVAQPAPAPIATPAPSPTPSPTPTPSIFQILDAVSKATVRIDGDLGQGTGVIIDVFGYVLTANHVVHEMASVVVTHPDGREERGLVLGRDELRDLAVVKISGNPDLPVIRMADFASLKPGAEVLALGYPGFNESITTTSGVISAILTQEIYDFTIVQTDTAFYSGLSGGPLITPTGELIALITSSPALGAGYTTGIDEFALETIEELKAGVLILKTTKGGLGHSNQNPAPLNHTVRIIGPSLSGVAPTVHEITVRQLIRGDEALALLRETYRFNPEPPPDSEYLLALVEMRYVRGPQGETDWIHQVDFGLISSQGFEYNLPFGVFPVEPFLSTRLYPGAIVFGWTTWLIEANDPAPLLIWGLDWRYRGNGFFTLAELPDPEESGEGSSDPVAASVAGAEGASAQS